MMDDPCNLIAAHQKPLSGRRWPRPARRYPHELVNSDSETADINAVVDFIRRLRGVDKVSLIGWSGGGIRTGTFAVRYPEKVDRYVIWASSNYSRRTRMRRRPCRRRARRCCSRPAPSASASAGSER